MKKNSQLKKVIIILLIIIIIIFTMYKIFLLYLVNQSDKELEINNIKITFNENNSINVNTEGFNEYIQCGNIRFKYLSNLEKVNDNVYKAHDDSFGVICDTQPLHINIVKDHYKSINHDFLHMIYGFGIDNYFQKNNIQTDIDFIKNIVITRNNNYNIFSSTSKLREKLFLNAYTLVYLNNGAITQITGDIQGLYFKMDNNIQYFEFYQNNKRYIITLVRLNFNDNEINDFLNSILVD